MEPLESTSAVNLTKAFLEGTCLIKITAFFSISMIYWRQVEEVTFLSNSSFRTSEHCKDTTGPGCKTSWGMTLLKARVSSQTHSFQNECCSCLTYLSFVKDHKAEVWEGRSNFQLSLGTRRFGFCGAALGSDEKEWVDPSFFRKVGLMWLISLNLSKQKAAIKQLLFIKGVISYQDIGDCLKLVTEALRYGDIKPWVWKDVSVKFSSLGKDWVLLCVKFCFALLPPDPQRQQQLP